MTFLNRFNCGKNPAQNLRPALVAAIAAVGLMSPAAMAHDWNVNDISIDGIELGESTEEILAQLIALDADDISDIKADMDEARADIIDAIDDIEEAREDVKDVPGGGIILKIAFGSARTAISATVDDAFSDVRYALKDVETELGVQKSDVGAAEFQETTYAIGVIRNGLDDIEDALDELISALQ